MITKQCQMNWFDYYFRHCLLTGLYGIQSSFKNWLDLINGNYEEYVLLPGDCPFTECFRWFWHSLGADDVLSKQFLEELCDLVETYDLDENLIKFSFFDSNEEVIKSFEMSDTTRQTGIESNGDK